MTDVLAGYISGTTVNLVQVAQSKGKMKLSNQRTYISKNFSGFESILSLYLRNAKADINAACFGVAGPVIRNEVSTTNLPWHIAGQVIEEKFSLRRVKLQNDIVSTAHGLSQLGADKFYTINEGHKPEKGNVGLIVAGSGLGEAMIYNDGENNYPYASEGGHADFAPGNQLEMELWEYIYGELGQVEVEDVISLSGLERIYNFLVDTRGSVRPDWFESASDRPAAIIEQALSGADDTASRTLDIFIDCYASEAANVALKGMTIGGVFIGGLIAPRIITAIDRVRFMDRFVKKGKMEGLLARMPVGVIIEEKTALLGAAVIALSI